MLHHVLFMLAALAPVLASGSLQPAGSGSAPKPAEPFWQNVPTAAFKFELVPIPGSDDGSLKPFYIGRLELTWEAFDVFVYSLDQPDAHAAPGADAVSRPSKPYLPPDRGFGHEGYAAISMSFKNASEFCAWLSKSTGRRYRLPTEAEWEHAARAGATTDSERLLGKGVDGDKLADFVVFADNAAGEPAPAGSKKPNAFGLKDMLGNVQEWVVGTDGKPVTKGGSYRSKRAELSVTGRARQEPSWNASDPQIPKSTWWLSDGPFVGFRVVCEMQDNAPAPAGKPTSPKP